MAELREIPPEQLKEIIEEYQRWVESNEKEGEQADLSEANFRWANLTGANLQGANLGTFLRIKTMGLTAPQVKQARNWELAFYDDDFLKELGLPPDHNETLPIKLAELE